MIGAACSITESGRRFGSRSTRKFATSASSLRVVSTTAFGLPVVPSGVGEPQRRVLVATDVAQGRTRRPDQARQLADRDHVLDLGRRVAVVDQPAGLRVVDLVGVLVRGLTVLSGTRTRPALASA